MPGTNQFLPFAVGAGANTLTPTAYAALTALLSSGFAAGVAPSAVFNTAFRQATTAAAGVAQFIADQGGSALDDGVPANFSAALKSAFNSLIGGKIQSVSASASANALTCTYAGGSLDFRSATLTNGAPISGVAVSASSIVVPSGATLGTVNAVAARLVLLVAYNAGTPVLCITNLAGCLQLDETNLISPTTISSGSTSAGVIYSASAVAANSPYRVVGFVDITEATAGTWASAPTQVQGVGGQALVSMSSIGYGQTWQDVTASRSAGVIYTNTTGKPIFAAISLLGGAVSGVAATMTVNGVQVATVGYGNTQSGQMTAIVPPGGTYGYTQTNTTLYKWTEFR